MIVVIDGYNLIKQVLGVKRVSQKELNKIVSEIADYLRERNVKGVIVFDGGSSKFPYQEKHEGGVVVIFSGYKESADEVIAQYVQDHREHELLVVSSDRAVRQYAESLGKQTIKAPDFYYAYLQKIDSYHENCISKDDTPFKIHESSAALDSLMVAGSEVIEVKDGERLSMDNKKEAPSKKLSKKKRKLKKVLDKLD
jgi:predicted RNA-binding protein with PIN domain